MDIAVLASGRGSNLRAIAEAIDRGACTARVVAVVSDKADAAALAFASGRGVATAVVEPRAHASRALWDAALAETVASFSPDLVVLAGFMRIVGASMLARFPQRIVNVHPALLPSFPGAHGARDAIAKGVRISGCTVHLVDAGVDTGPILAQAAVPVLPTDDEASLQARIQRAEHRLLPAVIDAIARGAITLGPAGPALGAALSYDEGALFSPAPGGPR
jgi:phosphoribosylglycinamide formyltransferase-1